MDILAELQTLADEEYKTFNARIIPTGQRTLGVRMPALRKIAKRIIREDPYGFIEADKNGIYEMVMLEGMVLAGLDRSFPELLPLLEEFLAKVDNWAQIDSTICECKRITRERSEVLIIVRRWLASENEFVVRAGLVILLAHFIDRRYLETIFTLADGVKHRGYYVHMATAWLISVCMAKFPEQTIAYLHDNSLDDATHNMAIRKSRESRRVSAQDKQLLKALIRKRSRP